MTYIHRDKFVLDSLRTVFRLIKSNGMYWLMLYILERLTRRNSTYFYDRRVRYETANRLPGFNTVDYNYREWSRYDWSGRGGEEWSESDEWKQSLIRHVIDPNPLSECVTLEIGPGGGRWSVVLAERSQRLILVDLTQSAIDVCRERLQNFSNCEFFLTNGNSLSFLESSTIDFIWSFDVFVHMAPVDVANYIAEMNRVMRPDALAFIHHATRGTNSKGYRSSLTNEMFLEYLSVNGLELVNQISSWENGKFSLEAGDVISVFRKTVQEKVLV